MANLIHDEKEQISSILNKACEKAVEKGELPAGTVLSGSGEERYLTSGETGDFGRMAAIFLGWQPKRGAEHIPPMEVE